MAACGCCCPLDAGTCSARTQKFSVMAWDDGHGHWVRLLLHGSVASVVLASAYSFWSTLYTENGFTDASCVWMQFPGRWWKLLGSDPEVWRPG